MMMENRRLLDNDFSNSGAETQRDMYVEQQLDKERKHHFMYHLCHPRTHFTTIGFILVTIIVAIFGIAFVCNWTHNENTIIPAKHGLQYGSWMMPLALCLFVVVHMWAVLGPIHSLSFCVIACLGSFGMNTLLKIQFHDTPTISYLDSVQYSLTNKITFPISQALVLYLSHCMADTVIYGKISKHRMDERDGRRLLAPQLIFLPIIGGLVAFCIDEFLFGPLLYNGGIVSYNFQNTGYYQSMYFGMSIWYFLVAAILRVVMLALYLCVEVLLDFALVLVSQKMNDNPDRARFLENLIYSVFRPAYSSYRIEIDWISTFVGVARFVFVYVFVWIIWACFGIMFSTIVDPFILRIIGIIVFAGVGIASIAGVLAIGKKNDEEPYNTIN